MRITRLLLLALPLLAVSCGYDDEMDVVPVSVRLAFPESYTGTYDGIRVEFRDATASVFVDSTDADGVARFTVPSGVYSATSSSQKTTGGYRYFFNGSKSNIVVASDSSNVVPLKLTMSRKRIVP